VVIPAFTQLRLRLDVERCPDTTFLGRLAPSDLQALWLTGERGCERFFTAMDHLEGLESLDLWATSVGDEAMQFASRLPNLRELDLWGTRVSDGSLTGLASLAGLRRLTVPGRHTTDAGLTWVATLGELRELDLSGSSMTDGGLAALTRARSLVRLSLWGTRVTDAGLASLRELPWLAEVNLGGTAVTDRGLAHLQGLALRRVSLDDTLVSSEGLRELRAALGPGCRIEPGDSEGCRRWRSGAWRGTLGGLAH
jgi:hypothetical protein